MSSIAWGLRCRRLNPDYERTCESGEAFGTVAMTGLMARRLRPWRVRGQVCSGVMRTNKDMVDGLTDSRDYADVQRHLGRFLDAVINRMGIHSASGTIRRRRSRNNGRWTGEACQTFERSNPVWRHFRAQIAHTLCTRCNLSNFPNFFLVA